MVIKEIRNGIYGLISRDWNRRLFDELIPLPEGTTYNSYLIRDRKTVLIDSSDPTFSSALVEGLKQAGVEKLDYIVSNHSEQDHSGSIPVILEMYPGSKVIASVKAADLLKSMLRIPEERIIRADEGEVFSIGSRSLKFIYTPWVHWPETMVSYCPEERILFSCDLFGSHLAQSGFYACCSEKLYDSAKRYYAEIMMPFRTNIKNHMKVLGELDIDIIAPSHGPVYDKPSFIMDAYSEWISDSVKNSAVIPYVSMHGSVAAMVDFLTDQLISHGIRVKPINLTGMDLGELAISLVDAATVVLGTPMVLAGPHPSAFNAAYLLKALRPKTRFASVIGSFGWGGNMLKMITEMLPRNIELIEPVIIKGYPSADDFGLIENLAASIHEKHRQLELC